VALKFGTFTDESYDLVSVIFSRKKWHYAYLEALELLNKKGILLSSVSMFGLAKKCKREKLFRLIFH
jgi:hypothetical protein